jgi:hypothetical protein
VQVFRDSGWDGKTPPLPQADRKKHHKQGSKAAGHYVMDTGLAASAEDVSAQELGHESERRDDHEAAAEAEVVAGSTAAGSTAAQGSEPSAASGGLSLEDVKQARAAALRQQQQLAAGLKVGWLAPWWQQQRSMQLQRLRGANKAARSQPDAS